MILEEAPLGIGKRSEEERPPVRFRRERYWLQPRESIPRDEDADLLYRLEWRPQPSERPLATSNTGDWLIVEHRNGLANTLAEYLRRYGQRAEVASSSQPTPTGHYGRVVYLCSQSEETNTPTEAEAATLGLLHLVQALSKAGSAARLWIVTRGSQAVTGTEAIQVAQAPLWGLARTIRLEHPEFQTVSIDLSSETNEFDHLVAEMLAPGESQVAYRKGTRYVARLARDNGKPGAQSPVIRKDGCYLITGGLGALGLR